MKGQMEPEPKSLSLRANGRSSIGGPRARDAILDPRIRKDTFPGPAISQNFQMRKCLGEVK